MMLFLSLMLMKSVDQYSYGYQAICCTSWQVYHLGLNGDRQNCVMEKENQRHHGTAHFQFLKTNNKNLSVLQFVWLYIKVLVFVPAYDTCDSCHI